jgi:hypothetical protein
VSVGTVYSHSGAAIFANSVDASEGGICASKNCVADGNLNQDLGSGTMVDDPPLSVQP